MKKVAMNIKRMIDRDEEDFQRTTYYKTVGDIHHLKLEETMIIKKEFTTYHISRLPRSWGI